MYEVRTCVFTSFTVFFCAYTGVKQKHAITCDNFRPVTATKNSATLQSVCRYCTAAAARAPAARAITRDFKRLQ